MEWSTVTRREDASESKDGEKPRHRAPHKNSHSGCLTCKQRHVKCDEGTPSCARCHLAGKKCEPGPPPSRKKYTRRHFSSQASTRISPSSQSYGESCLQYFTSVTLPAFHRCEPSPLWEYIRTELAHSTSVQWMAIALGHEHYTAALSTPQSTPEEALHFYPYAVQSLREAIEAANIQNTPTAMFAIIFHCLLLVILQCFRKSFDELNIHLQHGFRIATQVATNPQAITGVPLSECVRLMKQYSLAVALFNPLLPQDGFHAGFSTTTANQALSDPESLKASTPSLSTLLKDDQILRAEGQNLVLDLIRTTLFHRQPQLNHHDGSLEFASAMPADAALTTIVTKLRERHATLESAMQKRLLSKRTPRVQHLKIGSATTMLLGIYLRRRWSGYHCNYDLEFETFSTILDRIESALETELSKDTDTATDSASAFSIDLGTIAPLFYVAIMCREATIRRRAIELLSKCPSQDGPWNSKLAELVARAIMEFEERKAAEDGIGYALTSYVPEHCRVCYYYYHSSVTTSGGSDQKEHLRVFYRPSGTRGPYAHEDLDLT